ncbi:predicted protein [Histoplasma capsulatum var. duboisii H88]|uniref:Predicted protein n=1 Tax=Ajellomyces capsulatus (strain H88) TaxID=544711 RepID=F0URG8_AJEC8|nr:predicted protein [Histoplasma capsulatum var. duboisii H88]
MPRREAVKKKTKAERAGQKNLAKVSATPSTTNLGYLRDINEGWAFLTTYSEKIKSLVFMDMDIIRHVQLPDSFSLTFFSSSSRRRLAGRIGCLLCIQSTLRSLGLSFPLNSETTCPSSGDASGGQLKNSEISTLALRADFAPSDRSKCLVDRFGGELYKHKRGVFTRNDGGCLLGITSYHNGFKFFETVDIPTECAVWTPGSELEIYPASILAPVWPANVSLA